MAWQEVWQASGDAWMLCHPAVKISSPPKAKPSVKQSAVDWGLAKMILLMIVFQCCFISHVPL
jgi:hypothetical protein